MNSLVFVVRIISSPGRKEISFRNFGLGVCGRRSAVELFCC